MTVTVLPEVMQDMADSAYRQQVYIVAETQMHVAPWLFEDEGWDKSRLKAAIELVCTGKVTQTADGWHVQGASREGYDLPGATLACPCKAAAHNRKTSVCKHRVAVELARRVQQAYPQDTPLPFGPTPVDERLAQSVALGTLHDNTALQTSHTPQEDRMADEYIPEPDDENVSPVAVLDAPERKEERKESPRPLPGPVLLPSLDARTLEQSMQAWSAQRQVVKRFLQQELVEGTDYYTLRIKGRETKPALSKAGSEKFMALFQLHASFEQDSATWTMLGMPQGTLCYVCRLHTRSGELIGEGRGARTLQQDGGDINKAVKMASKSAMVDAILRTGALSDVFTQDEESIPGATVETPARPTGQSQDLRQRIWARVQQMAPEAKTRDAVEAYIKGQTGMDLHPDLYGAILSRLLEEGR